MSKIAEPKEAPTYKPRKMQLATTLSDLSSLRASNAQSARALVSVRPPPPAPAVSSQPTGSSSISQISLNTGEHGASEHGDFLDDYQGDPELERAFKLAKLHRQVKLAYMEPSTGGIGEEEIAEETGQALPSLRESRESVRLVARSFGFNSAPPAAETQASSNEQHVGHEISTQDGGGDEIDEEVEAWS